MLYVIVFVMFLVIQVVRLRVAELVKELSNNDKEHKVLVLLHVLRNFRQSRDEGNLGIVFWSSLDIHSSGTQMLQTCSIDVLQVIHHGAGVERVNKNHDAVHTKARASMSESTTVMALYVFTNYVLQQKSKMSFDEYMTTVLTPGDADSVLNTIRMFDDYETTTLPQRHEGEVSDDSDGDDEDDESDAEDEVDEVMDVPEGFAVVPCPAQLISSTQNLYVMMFWESEGWQIGKVMKFAPTRKVHNYDIAWDEGLRGSKLSMSSYHDGVDEDLRVVFGSWCYLKKTP